MKSLPTVTTVETRHSLSADRIRIDGLVPTLGERNRVLAVVDKLRTLAKDKTKVRVESRNPNVDGKGLGFSAAGFAALGLAASNALGLRLGYKELSQIVRLGAGSAARSLVGGFSIWYADKNGDSYAEQLASAGSIKMKTVIVPVPSPVKTDRAHRDAVTSPFYRARLHYLSRVLSAMKSAIEKRDVGEVCRLAEIDTLNLHAVTMTGRAEMVLFSPLSISIIDEVQRLREEENAQAWFSLDTGPSVFVNTTFKDAPLVHRRIRQIAKGTILSELGGPAETIRNHLC